MIKEIKEINLIEYYNNLLSCISNLAHPTLQLSSLGFTVFLLLIPNFFITNSSRYRILCNTLLLLLLLLLNINHLIEELLKPEISSQILNKAFLQCMHWMMVGFFRNSKKNWVQFLRKPILGL